MPNNVIGSPFQYTSVDYDSILSNINSDSELVTKPNWWKRLWAGIGDLLSVMINQMANLLFLRTSFTRQSVMDLLQLIDYTLTAHSTSSGIEMFYINSTLGTGIFPYTPLASNLAATSIGSIASSSMRFEAISGLTFSLVQSSFTTNYAVNNNLTVGGIVIGYTGHKCRLTTTGSLPAPLQTNTDYYIIYFNSSTIQLANSLSNAFAGINIVLTSNGSPTNTLTLYSATVTVQQQTTLTSQVNIGQSDGLSSWQEFRLPNSYMLASSLVITINGVQWTQVTTFINSTSTSKVYKVFPMSQNNFGIRFGNGTYGAIPGSYAIMALYAYGGGANSIVSSLNRITNYAGSDSNITGCTNVSLMTGGADEQVLNDAKQLGPTLLKARTRFITLGDGEALALNFGGISWCSIISNAYGPLSCQVLAIAPGGGNPSGAVQTALQNYLISISTLSSINVVVSNATLSTLSITSAIHLLSGYTYTGQMPYYFKLAWQLFISETGYQIQQNYINNGIASTVTLINSIFSSSFGVNDYTQIQQMVSNPNWTPRNFGDTIQQSEAFTFIESSIIGCQYITITAFGSGFPYVCSSTSITTATGSTLTLSSI